MDAPVLLPAGLILLAALRPLLAEADRLQLVGGNAQLHQEVLGGAGALVAQQLVVLGRAAFIAMPFDGDDGAGEVGDDGLQRGGVLRQRGLRIGADVALIVVEVAVLQFRDPIRQRLGRRWWRGRRRWWRRRRDIHGRAGRASAARSGGGQSVGGGIIRRHTAGAGVLDGADGLIDQDAGHVAGDRPTRHRSPAAHDGSRVRAKLGHRRRGWWWWWWWRRLHYRWRWRRRYYLLLAPAGKYRQGKCQSDECDLSFTEHELAS